LARILCYAKSSLDTDLHSGYDCVGNPRLNMYCSKCGKENPDDAVYCQKCGTMLEAEEETRVVEREYLQPRPRNADTLPNQGGEPEARIFSISPTLMFVKIGYVLAVIGGLLLVAFFSVFVPFVTTWAAVLIGLLLLLIPAFYHFRQKLIRYSLTDTTVEIDTGLVSRTTRNVPLRRVQDVTVSAGVWQRLLGFGDVIIDNASEEGGKVVLKNINSPRKYADLVLKQMRLLDR
jgi:membrane protein YdbS with pleckstrin-like domain